MANANDDFTAASGKRLKPSGEPCNLIEEVTGAQTIIASDHVAIHKKIAFTTAKKFTIAAAASAYLELIIPEGAYIHFKPIAMQTDAPKITVQLIEAPTLTTGVTGIVPVNRHRFGTPAPSVVTVHTDPADILGGTVLDQDYIGGGTGTGANAVSGGNASNDNEWILKPDTTYLIKVTNGGSGSADVNVKTFWYEETGA